MFEIVKQIFISVMMSFGFNIPSVNLLNVVSVNAAPLNTVQLKCVSINN